MGQAHANVSRDIYNELLEYFIAVFQQGPNKPLVDADINDVLKSIYRQIRRTLELFGDGSPDANAFLIAQSTINNVNNFAIKGGGGSMAVDDAGRIVAAGHLGRLWYTSIEFDSINVDAETLHDRSTALTATKLTNTGANWTVNEFAGRTIYPNTRVATGFAIISNTQTEINISGGDMTTVAAMDDPFRVAPSTPGAPRPDVIYLDVYLDEIDELEDPNLEHPLSGGSSFVSALRYKLKHVLHVRENSTGIPTNGFQDPDQNLHYYIKLATLTRDANNTILTAEIADEVNRDIYPVQAIRDEIKTARGTEATLDDRLDVSLNEDGSLKSVIIFDANIAPTADIDQTKIANSGVYDDTYVGVPSDLEDDLNRLRTEIKITKGTVGWETPPTRDVETLDTDLAAAETILDDAKGSKTDLDDRLDVSLNEDGTLKPVSVFPGIPKLAAEQAMVFYPKNSSPYDTYRLHQMRGTFRKTVGGVNYGPYHDYGRDFGAYALDVAFAGAYGPGAKDNDPGHAAGPQAAWYYVYLIGKADGSLDLVYSTAARPPWASGPLLDNSLFDFPAAGWIYWKFVAAVLNLSLGSWELAQLRKIGNHVSYELGQRAIAEGSFADTGWLTLSLASRVPTTSMRVNVSAFVIGKDGTQQLFLRPPNPTPPSGGIPGLHEIPSWPATGLSMDYQLHTASFTISPGLDFWNNVVGWVDLNDLQEIGLRHIGAGTDHNAYVDVLGYEEWTDFESTALTW